MLIIAFSLTNTDRIFYVIRRVYCQIGCYNTVATGCPLQAVNISTALRMSFIAFSLTNINDVRPAIGRVYR